MVAQEELVWKHRTAPGGIVTLTGVEVPSKNTWSMASVVAVDGFRRHIEPSMFTQKTTSSLCGRITVSVRSSLKVLQPKLQLLTEEVMSVTATIVKSQYPSSPQWFLLSAFEVATVLSAVASVLSRWQELSRKKEKTIAAKVFRGIPTGGGAKNLSVFFIGRILKN
jgi:hypothetical protein